jgi:valyl-tRNA synthetase
MEKLYEHQTAEARIQQKWQQEKTYSLENNPGKLYSIDTPPPTVSGSLHIGHIFSYTQTDIVARYKRMNGYSVFYPFGFDDNGLPTERYVEKKREIKAHEMPRSEFITICLQETHHVEQQFIALWQKMGLSANWEALYSTISELARTLSQESFIELYKKGFIFRKHEPALYCTACRTSVAQAELDDAQKPSFFNDIVFHDEQGNDLIIGTTRPELLPSCVAVLFNPKDERYQHLRGKKATVPLFAHQVPILEDEHVDIEKGTGLVMCCTFGDKADIEWYKKFKLPYKQSIGFDGRFIQSAGFLAGLKVPEARTKVLEELKNTNLLIAQKPITHAVNVHERCKKEIEIVALEQWFVNILDHKQKFLDMGDQVEWYPSFMKARYKDWVENLSWDWCISRQRFFGIPFPVWHCKACKQVLLADVAQLPVDPQEMKYDKPCPHCKSTDIVPDTDVMDTWNTSSITPYICAALYNNKHSKASLTDSDIKSFIPMSMRPQAHDIIRTWAFDTIVKVWMHQGSIPWSSIVISGHVLSDGKEKLSKSKDNSKLTPENLLSTYSADIIRYWTASGSLGHDVAFSENQLKIGGRLTTKIWNAFRFVFEHIQTLENPNDLPREFGDINNWLLHTSSKCFDDYQRYFEQNEFGLALQKVESFFWADFCDNYLELVKNQLFNPQEYSPEQVYATKVTLYHVGLRILQMYSPYIPHITESIYEAVYMQKENIPSIHQTKFASIQKTYTFKESADLIQQIVALTSEVRKLKTVRQLSLKTALQTLTVHVADKAALESAKSQEQLVKGITQAVEIKYEIGLLETTDMKDENGVWHAQVNF